MTSFTRPRLGLVELGVLLWRAKWLMIPVFAAVLALGLWYAFQQPKEYVAQSRVQVALSEEYIFRPRVGDGVQNNVPETEQLVLDEIELMRSPVIAERVLEQFGLETIYPKISDKLATAPEDKRYEIERSAVRTLSKNFTAYAAPKGSVIRANFAHSDPAMSADVLNAVVETYVAYRAEVFSDRSPRSLERQREQFEVDLRIAENDLLRFLTDNGLSDFTAEQAAVRELFSAVEQAILVNRTGQSELDGQTETLRQQLANATPLVDLFVEDTTAQSLVALELEREELLTRYKPESKTVQDIDQRIARASQFRDGQTGAVGTVRRGPNPVYQGVETALGTARSQAVAARREGEELARQSILVESRQRRIAELEPRWLQLVRRRDLLEANARNFATRAVEARALAEIAREGSDNIRILEPARRPDKGTSLKLIIAAGSLVFGSFCALIIGLFFALTRKGFVTPASLQRTVGLPVVSTVRRHK